MGKNQSGFTIVEVVATAVIVGLVAVGVIAGVSAFVDWNNNRQHSLGRGDAPTQGINKEARKVYEMPDRFSNVATFCDQYGNVVYVTTKSDQSRAIFALKDGCEASQKVEFIGATQTR